MTYNNGQYSVYSQDGLHMNITRKKCHSEECRVWVRKREMQPGPLSHFYECIEPFSIDSGQWLVGGEKRSWQPSEGHAKNTPISAVLQSQRFFTLVSKVTEI